MDGSFFFFNLREHVSCTIQARTTVGFVVLRLSCVGLRAVQKLNRMSEQWGRKQYSLEDELVSKYKVGMDTSSKTPLCLTQSMFYIDLLYSRSLIRLFFPSRSGEMDIIIKKREHQKKCEVYLPIIVGIISILYLKAKAEKYFLLFLDCLELKR